MENIKMATEVAVNTEPVRDYSPLTLCLEWSKMGRLLFLVGLSTLGTVMNGFFVSAFFVERHLRKIGYVFHACVGLSDFVVTTVIIPTCSVVLLSGQWDIEPVCYALHILGIFATYSYSSFFMMVAVESHYRVHRPAEEYKLFTPLLVVCLTISIFLICLIVAGVGVFLEYDYNYCNRTHYGNFKFRLTTALIFHVVPFFITLYCLITSSMYVQRRARKHIQYKRSLLFECDSSATSLNISVYLFFVMAWLPYLIIVYWVPDSSDSYFYHFAWLGLSRTVVSTFIYAFLNRIFRRAYAHLFNYCCCKNTLSSSFAGRHRRALEYRPTTGDIRVHIMHQAIASPPRFCYSSRETQEL